MGRGLTTEQRGLGWQHRKLRAALIPAAIGRPCPLQGPRCDRVMTDPKRMELDHTVPRALGGRVGDRIVCMPCNRGRGAALGNKLRQDRRRRVLGRIREWPGAGVEIAADRSQTWVARAAYVDEVRVVVELLPPVAGTSTVLLLLPGWVAEWQTRTVGIDPRSPSATLVAPLRDTLTGLAEVDAHAMSVAHGGFHDLLDGGQLKVRGHSAVDDAARRASARKLAGSYAVDRYGGAEPAPLVACQLAVWALVSAKKFPPPDVF
jgi:hypothetical protein